MVLIKPDEGDGAAQEALAVAEQHFARTLKTFNEVACELESGQAGAKGEFIGLARALQAAIQVLFQEKKKIADSIKKDSGVVHQYALDFNAAREEIQRRMARLRAAGSSGEVSE